MQTIYNNGVCINYTKEEISNKNLLLNALKNDPYIFKRILPKNILLHNFKRLNNIIGGSEDSVYIEDVYSYLKDKMTPIFENIQSKCDEFGKDRVLFEVYLSALKYKYDTNDSFSADVSSEDLVYSYLAMLYSDGVDSYLDFITKPSKNLREELFNVASYDYREKALNYFLRDLKMYFNKLDENYFKIIECIYNNFIYTQRDSDFDPLDLSIIDRDTFDDLVKEILVEIDPTYLWLELYEKGIKDESIIYLYSEEDMDKYSIFDSCVDKNGNMYVVCDNTLFDVVVSIHEFCHYVNRKCGSYNRALCEYPPVLFEEFTFDFLINQGYSSDEINFLRSERYNLFSNYFHDSKHIFKLMSIQDKSPDKDINDFHTIYYVNPKNTDTIIDSEIEFLISNSESIIDKSDYLVADFFRRYYLKIYGNNLRDMVNTCENTSNIDISQLVLRFNRDKNNK